MAAFGPRVSRRTAFRKLKDLHARTSYSHRGGYYTLDELADFDEHGLWTFAGVRFSRAGTLVATAEAFVNHAEAGHFVDELDNLLGVGTQDALRKLVGDDPSLAAVARKSASDRVQIAVTAGRAAGTGTDSRLPRWRFTNDRRPRLLTLPSIVRPPLSRFTVFSSFPPSWSCPAARRPVPQ